MCGLVGYFGFEHLGQSILQRMCLRIENRGPNQSGVYIDENLPIGLGHQRLSIIDLSQAGAQPMASSDERYIIAYNGEVYNHNDLRKGHLSHVKSWRGHSDTETILQLIQKESILEAVSKLKGMFAMAVWDKKDRVLHLVRDRFGEKPLYYGFVGRTLIFGSEVHALSVVPGFNPELDREALYYYTKYSYVPAPLSIYKNVKKVRPGTIMSFQFTDGCRVKEPKVTEYWSVDGVVQSSKNNIFSGTFHEATELLEAKFLSAVEGQMMSDVPLGCFLSGGIDSSMVAAAMQCQSRRKVKSFTIGFNEAEFNEAVHAKTIAKHLNLEHHELYLTAKDALKVVPEIPKIYSEPFADVSQIPTYLLSKMASQNITVALAGDGGDELLGGYSRYVWSKKLEQFKKLSPKLFLLILSKLILHTPASLLQNPLPFGPLSKVDDAGLKIHKFAKILATYEPEKAYDKLISQWDDPMAILNFNAPFETAIDSEFLAGLPDVEQMMRLDALNYLPNDILVKSDRASMANSLECRNPYLDHNLFEFCWGLPENMKVHDGKGKYILREMLYKYVPQHLVDRPKTGFSVPIGKWLNGELRDWAEDLLSPASINNGGVYNSGNLLKLWQEHKSGLHNHQYKLWGPLMMQAWLRAV